MKKLLIALVCVCSIASTIAEARYTNSYYRSNGTYVQGYWGN